MEEKWTIIGTEFAGAAVFADKAMLDWHDNSKPDNPVVALSLGRKRYDLNKEAWPLELFSEHLLELLCSIPPPVKKVLLQSMHDACVDTMPKVVKHTQALISIPEFEKEVTTLGNFTQAAEACLVYCKLLEALKTPPRLGW